MTRPDFVVVGQGLAGTVLAWRLRAAGARVLVFDDPHLSSASRVAAGLLTPVTGQRMAKTWRLDDAGPAAVAFYRRSEADTGKRFFHARRMVRLFADDTERSVYESRATTLLAGAVRPLDPPPDPAAMAAPHGGFEMPDAAQLDVPAFLDASRAVFANDGGFRPEPLDPATDVFVVADGVALPRFGVRAGGIVFCQGFSARGNPWFPHIRFNPVKGEILTVRVPGLAESRVIHRGVWLAPTADADVFRVGATYDRTATDTDPTDAGRAEVTARLRSFLRLGYEVVGHAAGVRPVIQAGRPALGSHPVHGRRVAYFNGLGSKGSLIAPLFAEELVRHLLHGEPVEPDVDVRRLPGGS
ncbi:MAG: NAD(P)/FAD-dependent oxidoreductase [Fimbriiglobus sp.]